MTDDVPNYTEQYGLFHIATRSDKTLDPAGNTFDVDIIAVHGLGGDAYRTWTHADGNVWLAQLHDRLPGARIYTFGYDSGFAFSRGTGTIEEFARSLLAHIMTVRNTDEVRYVSKLPSPGIKSH